MALASNQFTENN